MIYRVIYKLTICVNIVFATVVHAKMEKGKRRTKLIKLSKEFEIDCRRDVSKRCILFSKTVLEGLNVWPDNDSFIKRWVIILSIISMGIMEVAHVVYVVMNITDISKVTPACTTVSTTIETMAKLATMIYFRDPLNEILTTIWRDFWPANITSKRCQNGIRFRSNYVVIVGATFLLMAFGSCAQFMAFPLVANTRQLPLASWYPFDTSISPIYELMTIWQWFMNQIVIATLSGFDSFFNSIVMICATQFMVLQEVLRDMCAKDEVGKYGVLFRRVDMSGINEMDVMVKCVKHHWKLIRICRLIEESLSHIVFLQFFVSTMAICVSSVALIADPSMWQHMLSYCVAHLLQFFIYCSVGNELTYQSGNVGESAYACDWETSDDINFKKGLIMIIQRSLKPEALTVAGLMQLSFANFVATVQMSFSFYTLLNTFV